MISKIMSSDLWANKTVGKEETVWMVEKSVYFTCSCGSLPEIGRVNITRDLRIPNNNPEQMYEVEFEMYFEFNESVMCMPNIDEHTYYECVSGTEYRSFRYKIKMFLKKLKVCWAIIREKPVRESTSIMIDRTSIENFCDTIKQAYNEVRMFNPETYIEERKDETVIISPKNKTHFLNSLQGG